MHEKNYKNANNEISNNEKKQFFGIFRLGMPRVANLTPRIDTLRNFTSIMYFWKFFFYPSKLLKANIAKKNFLFEENGNEK